LQTDKEKPKVKYETGDGSFLMSFEGKRIWVKNSSGKTKKVGWEKKEVTEKILILEAFGKSSTKVL
jgi:hypothetical protein